MAKREVVTEKRWVAARPSRRGYPNILPLGVWFTRRDALKAMEQAPWTNGCIPISVTLTYTRPTQKGTR